MPIFLRFSFSLLLACSFFSFASAQNLVLSPSSVDLGDVMYGALDSASLTLLNPHDDTIRVTSLRFFGDEYNDSVFYAMNVNVAIPPSGSESIWIYGSPVHNLAYNSEVMIYNDFGRGVAVADVKMQGKFQSYYNSTDNLSGEDLKAALGDLLENTQQNLTYNTARDKMFMEIDNQKVNGQGATQNTLEGVYTGQLAVGYANRSEAQTNDNFNTEHTFPQAFFSSAQPMKSDLHHIFPTKDYANSERGNLAFGSVSSPTWQEGGSKKGNGRFEPRDAQKGKTARAMMYFVTRYEDYSGFMVPQESILRQWHLEFLPDAAETQRNEAIFGVQNNRNPFIDYPHFIERIPSLTNNLPEPMFYDINFSADSVFMLNYDPFDPPYYTFSVVNSGNQPIEVTKVEFVTGDASSFGWLSPPSFPFELEAGENLDLKIDLLATDDSFETTVVLTTDYPTAQGGVFGFPVLATMSGISAIGSQRPQLPLSVYPNPSQDQFRVELEGNGEVQYELMDMMGRRLRSGIWEVWEDRQLDVRELPDGVYGLRVQTEDGVGYENVKVSH